MMDAGASSLLHCDAKWKRRGNTLHCTGRKLSGIKCRETFLYEPGGVNAPEICPGCGSFMKNTQRARQRSGSMVKVEAGA